MYNPFSPEPAPPGFGIGKILPEDHASWPSKVVFQWLGPLLKVGFTRPLEKDDLWELPPNKQTANLTDEIEANFYARCPPEKRPLFLRETLQNFADISGTASTSDTEVGEEYASPSLDTDTEKVAASIKDKKWTWAGKKARPNPVYDSSMAVALHKTFFYRWWISGLLKLFADTLNTTTPLVTKVLLTWLTEAYVYHQSSDEAKTSGQMPQPKGIGYGIGLAFALFAMQEISSLMTNHYMLITMENGLFVRTGIIGIVFRKSLRLSGRARLEHSVGQITTMISADTARLDRLCGFIHSLWVSPIQLAIGVGLLISNLGYSALVGLGVLLLGFPIQFVLVRVMFGQRKKGVKITDTRIRLTTEVLQGIRLIKYYSWENFYAHQIGRLRRREIQTIKKSAMARSLLMAVVMIIPVLASILSFITYALSGHELDIAFIFSSLQLFNIIRTPLMYIPLVLSSFSDGLVALGRISKYLTAEELAQPYVIDKEHKYAVEVDGDFTWETAGKIEDDKFNIGEGIGRSGKVGRRQGNKEKKRSDLPTIAPAGRSGDAGMDRVEIPEKNEEKPFELKNLNLRIRRGSFVAIVGRVGSGKSSVLQALIGEMRKTKGDVVFGGTVAYVPQTPWIRNATLRENVTFGQAEDEARFRDVMRACCLEHDLEMLPHGEETEIGEKGINLSGGQKARVSLARAAFSRSDIVLLDDPLSAVDAYVGRNILHNCLLNGPLADRTRILVTHALHVLDKTDYIYVMDGGAITEQGTYTSLTKDSLIFSRLIEEYGNLEQDQDAKSERKGRKVASSANFPDESDHKKVNAALMRTEERNTGSVSWVTYGKYFRFGGGIIWAPVFFGLLVAAQAASVSNNLFLGFWTAGSIPGFKQGEYMAVYAGLGAAQALFSFVLNFSFAIASLVASLNLFKAALTGVLRSPTSFFDTTPIGRIMSRLSKDLDTLDSEISTTLYQSLSTFSSVLGTVALVFYTFPLLGIIFAPLAVLYYGTSIYYRRSSVETKRLDSLMRSTLYSAYSETLTGLSTIRAYRGQRRSIQNAEHGLDMENRAYYMTIAIQRWLSVRLDFFGNVLVLGIALFAAGFRNTVNPSKIGVVLSYTLSITQIFSQMITQFAQNEQNMNAVERVLVYTELPPEGDATTPNDPPASWPEKGEIKFSNVKLAYREGLPLVLKDINFQVKSGEKVGIVGRTGAGKSSLLQALFRVVELHSGSIEIDDRDIRKIGLDVLRGRLALVPQDSTLFLGTLRENLDPLGSRTDAELISVLQRAWLLPQDRSPDPAAEAKFSLDSSVSDDGSNYSVGERQLLALCRALVKNSRIIVLDEATSNVDVETDSKLQRTIQTEFATSTLLCIAHRLNTVAYYDRVLVMDGGKIAEFDTVLNLFDKEDSIFRSLCNEAGLLRQDIVRIREDGAFHRNKIV